MSPVDALMSELLPLLSLPAEALSADVQPRARALFRQFLQMLEQGHVRAAIPLGEPGLWQVQPVIKQTILFGFRLGQLTPMGDASLPFIDKDTYPVRSFTTADRVRIVPGGSAVRRGCFVAAGVTVMPPAYINAGAYVDEGSMIDSHALVGSCAQIGKRVHLSAAAQIGGVLEPVGAMPVIIEDDALIGGNCGVYEGTIVCKGAVLGAGVVLTRSTKVFDLVHERELCADDLHPLVIPPGAVVVPGSRPASSSFATSRGLHIATPLIIKYRDDKTDAKAALESALRA
jgi:2,3,4,5-tetrahydropyridine-2,6-dicarboxylate N-succinyltransferase